MTNRERTRRQFLLEAAVGGGLLGLASCSSEQSSRREEPPAVAQSIPLIRNPAFSFSPRGSDLCLSATCDDGREVVYRVDRAGLFLWQNTTTVDEYLAGKQVITEQLLDVACREYASQDPVLVRERVLAFLQRAVEAGILMDFTRQMTVVQRSA